MAVHQDDAEITVMGILKNAKHEAMALFLADGLPQEKAYIKAGYSKKGARGSASTLLKQNPSIFKRRDELLAERESLRSQVVVKAAKNEQVTQEYVLSRLKTVADRCLQSAPVLDRKGNPVIVEAEDEEGAGHMAVAYVFNPMGANRALELLGKEIGMFVERKEQGKPGEFADLKTKSADELEQEAREILAAGVKGGVLKLVSGKTRKAA